jgi:hypothetical protein
VPIFHHRDAQWIMINSKTGIGELSSGGSVVARNLGQDREHAVGLRVPVEVVLAHA